MLGGLMRLRNLSIMAGANARNGAARVLRKVADLAEHRHRQ